MKQAHYYYGLNAEQTAAAHYIAKGYKILEQRYKTPVGEIDLIVHNATTLVFIEVKARINPMHSEYISPRQIKRYCATADLFIAQNMDRVLFEEARFDLVVIIDGAIAEILENAWGWDDVQSLR